MFVKTMNVQIGALLITLRPTPLTINVQSEFLVKSQTTTFGGPQPFSNFENAIELWLRQENV